MGGDPHPWGAGERVDPWAFSHSPKQVAAGRKASVGGAQPRGAGPTPAWVPALAALLASPHRGPSPQTAAEILGPLRLPPTEAELRSLGRLGPAAIGYRLASWLQPGPRQPFMGCLVWRANRQRMARLCLAPSRGSPASGPQPGWDAAAG